MVGDFYVCFCVRKFVEVVLVGGVWKILVIGDEFLDFDVMVEVLVRESGVGD